MQPVSRGQHPPEFLVLVVDDDVDARRIYSEYLRIKGWTVFTAADGRAGIDKANELKPDVVVLDLAMPRVDGWTVLRHLRESSWTNTIPIVVVSAVTSARDEAYQFGCDAFLTKPCPPEVVWLQICALFRVRSQRRSMDWYGDRV
jgi:two-component system, cell cycle response regulator DivK